MTTAQPGGRHGVSSSGLIARAPATVVIGALVVLALGIVAAFTAIILAGKSTAELRDLITLVLAGVGALTGTGAWLYSGSAASSARAAEEQTNGALDRRIAAAVARGIANADQARDYASTHRAPPPGADEGWAGHAG